MKRSLRNTLIFTSLLVLGAGGLYLKYGQQTKQIEISFHNGSSQKQYKIVTIPEVFLTKRDINNNIDSVAVWHGQKKHWLLATAKSTHKVFIYDALTGKDVLAIGEHGKKEMQFSRPNGIAVSKDMVFVVERDNHRVQTFKLPHFKCVGCFGDDDLTRPYGIGLCDKDKDFCEVYVTDDYKPNKETAKNRRIHIYKVRCEKDKFIKKHIRSFGKSSGTNALKKVESILVDGINKRLFICDEGPTKRCIKIFSMEGEYRKKQLGNGLFKNEPEGIAMYKTGKQEDGTGYIVATDQSHEENLFHVFDRKTLKHLGAFKGKVTKNTDGITVTKESFGTFKKGAFYAVHDDGNVACFDWADVVQGLGL